MERRVFVRNTVMGMAAFAGTGLVGLGAEELKANGRAASAISLESSAGPRIGRPVRIVSIGFKSSMPLSAIEGRVDEEGSRGADLIVLPELCRGQGKTSEEPLHGPTVTAMAVLAKKHKTYIATPIDRRDGARRLNSVVLIDRSGQIACVYDKVFPYWSEYAVQPSVSPGESVQVYEADFGRVGIATCFDANFPEVWRRLSDKGAELVVWPSEYSGGSSLQAHAIDYHYYIVTSSQTPDCIVYDITGERLLYEKARGINVSRVAVDLDRGIYHQNFNIAKRDKLLKEHSEDIVQEQWMALEQWFVLKAKRPGVNARQLAHQYGLEELRHYIDRSRVAIDNRRGWEFAEKVVFPNQNIAELKTLSQKHNSMIG
ncbi:MAG TPA: carbon-nitrogen hydrolase family protein [Acidobacteriaceae bacterium]|jgi:predicted amidohydrolase|nr:carbon-nitrogen hydrolase family protein [Acidobacteriaceae bacterium]